MLCYRHIAKYRSTQMSNIFDNHRQKSSGFMTNSIEIQMLSLSSYSILMRALSFNT